MNTEQKRNYKYDKLSLIDASALQVDYPSSTPEELESILQRIEEARTQLVEQLGVDQELSSAQSMVLELIASEIIASADRDDQLRERQKDALTDAALVLFGGASVINRTRKEDGLDPNDKYIDSDVDNRQIEFLKSCANETLTERFREHLLSSTTFKEQCEKLNTTPKFDVCVIDILQSSDAYDEFRGVDSFGDDEVVHRSTQNSIAYEEVLFNEFGIVPTAMVWVSQGRSPTLVMRSSAAMRILEDQPSDDELTDKANSNLRHELSHTDKRFLLGASIQFGKFIEERKAEALSGDKAQYTDILRTFRAISEMSGVDITSALVDYTKSEEPISGYLEFITQHFGPKFALTLMMASPHGAYDSQDDESTALDIQAFYEEGDASDCDALFRLAERRFGSTAYVEKVVRPQAEDIANGEFRLEEGLVGMLSSHGISRIAKLYKDEFDRIYTIKAAKSMVE